MTRVTFTLVLVALALILTACGPGQLLGPTFTPTATATPTSLPPTITPLPTPPPTLAPTPTPTTGSLTGKLVIVSNGKPLAGAGIALCRIANDSCLMKTNLHTKTQSDGRFELKGIPPAKYVILHNFRGEVGWDQEVTIDLSKKSSDCLFEGYGPSSLTSNRSAQCRDFIPYFGKGLIGVETNSRIVITKEGFKIEGGEIFSVDYEACLNLQNGVPLSVEIGPSGTVEIEIEAYFYR